MVLSMLEKICALCGRLRLAPSTTQWRRLQKYKTQVENTSFLASPKGESLWKRGLCSSSLPSWEEPSGFDTGIRVYHPIVKNKVPLILKQENLAQWYACGPTVYDSPHIGHASSYVRLDIIRRIMSKVFGIDSTLVMGITDIDDKIIYKSMQTGEDMQSMCRMYEEEFFKDMSHLSISPPNIITRVTDHIPKIIDFIRGIEQHGLAYTAGDGSVYFDIKKYGNYPALISNLAERDVEESSHKRHSSDFALWKAYKPGEPYWESPWSKGRPGWHIECSAMASSTFGSNFDIHSGGEDLIFPHHENELAQSCAYHGNRQWVNYWLHTGHLFLTGDKNKMSKSLKNVMSLSELLKVYTPKQFRMLCLLSNYRKKIEYSDVRMDKAVSTLKSFTNLIHRCDLYVKGQIDCGDIPEAEIYELLRFTKQMVEDAFRDDFNTPRALAKLVTLVKQMNLVLKEHTDSEEVSISKVRSNAPVAAVGIYMNRVLDQLGLDISPTKTGDGNGMDLKFQKAVDSAVFARSKIREFAKNKDFLIEKAEEAGISQKDAMALMKTLYKPLWEASDEIRKDLHDNTDVEIRDGRDRCTWSHVESKPSSIKD